MTATYTPCRPCQSRGTLTLTAEDGTRAAVSCAHCRGIGGTFTGLSALLTRARPLSETLIRNRVEGTPPPYRILRAALLDLAGQGQAHEPTPGFWQRGRG